MLREKLYLPIVLWLVLLPARIAFCFPPFDRWLTERDTSRVYP